MSDSEDSFESADEGDTQARKESSKKSVVPKARDLDVQSSETVSVKSIEKDLKECMSVGENTSERKAESSVRTDASDTVPESVASMSQKESLQTENSCESTKSQTDNTPENMDKSQTASVAKTKAGLLPCSGSEVSESECGRPVVDKHTDSGKETTETATSKKQVPHKETDEKQKSGWGWSSWGSSLLQTASESVNTFTSSVGEGFSTVLETVESTLGAPHPSELATEQATQEVEVGIAEEKQTQKQGEKDEPVDPDEGPGSQDITREIGPLEEEDESSVQVGSSDESAGKSGWFSNFGVSSLTGVVKQTVQQTSSLVQEKGKGIVHSSLDVLETLGKKTYDVLAEGDHGLKKTIEKAKQKPNLSVVLREAAEEAAETAKREEEFVESQKSHFGAQFDEFQGLVQLEALEMLSNQCEGKLHSLLSAMSAEQVATVKQELVSIKEAFELGDIEDEDDQDTDHNFPELVTEFTGELGLNLTAEKLIQVHKKVRERVGESMGGSKDIDSHNIKAIHQTAIQSLAELTARTVGHFHRVGQLLLMDPKGPVSAYKSKAGAIASLTKCVCYEVGILSSKSTQYLTCAVDSSGDTENVNPLITSVFLEATNSSTYLQDAMQLLLPVVQQAAVESTKV